MTPARPDSPKPKVTVGVCGGVAAYRAIELVRLLQDAALDPHVVMTASAEEFIRPLTFAAISGHDVITSLWTGEKVPQGTVPEGMSSDSHGISSIEHIHEAQTTAALLIVPATAGMLGRLANGIADDFLTTMYLATEASVLIAPAMNVVMWQHPAVQANITILRSHGVVIIEPGAGYLACGMQGSGRLAELPSIVTAVHRALDANRPVPQDLAGETILVTAGGTREPIDSVRFLGNRSSGKMGYALAQEAQRRGARVLLISAPTALPVPAGLEVMEVTTAGEMHAAVMSRLPEATVVLKAAAVSDFRASAQNPGKLNREEGVILALEPTEDIAANVVKHRRRGTLVVAFAAEIADAVTRGREKMRLKGVDAIVINDVSLPGLGFDSDRNKGIMLTRERTIDIPEMSKREMARRVLDEVVFMRRFTPVSAGA